MKRFRKWIRKDRYGVVRGTIALCIVMLLCTAMLIRLFFSYDILTEEERASDAALRVTTQFEQLIENSLNRLFSAAGLMGEIPSESDAILKHLSESGDFSELAVQRGETLFYMDGSTAPYTAYEKPIAYVTAFEKARIFPSDDGQLQFSVPVDDASNLIGWLSTDQLQAVMCDAFEDDYGYAIYNAVTGDFIINHTILEDDGYYAALQDLNRYGSTETLLNSGEGQALIEHADGGKTDYYIAQQLTQVRPLGITLMIPEALVRSEAWNSRILPYATILTMFLMLATYVAYTIFSLRRVHLVNRDTSKALAIGEQMMRVISHEARITIFIHQRKQEKLPYYYDGLSLLDTEGIDQVHSLREVVDACGMEESEAEHLNESLMELAPGESTELLVHSSSNDHEERVLRFTLCASAKPEQGVICCISDYTQEQASLDRIELERSYQASVQAKTSSIWQINISRNRWHALEIKKQSALYSLNSVKDVWRDYNADLGALLRDYLHPADYAEFAETMSIENITSMFRSGKTEFSKDYRVCKAGCANYEWHRMHIRIWLNPETNDIYVNLYVFNVNAEKEAELERSERKRVLHQTLVALGGLYSGLYYVDLDNDLSYTARSLGDDLVTQLCTHYKVTFDHYIDNSVHPEDREELRQLLSAYRLRKDMTEGSHFRQKAYRRKVGDGYENALVFVQPARFENGVVKEVVLAIRYTGSEKDTSI